MSPQNIQTPALKTLRARLSGGKGTVVAYWWRDDTRETRCCCDKQGSEMGWTAVASCVVVVWCTCVRSPPSVLGKAFLESAVSGLKRYLFLCLE